MGLFVKTSMLLMLKEKLDNMEHKKETKDEGKAPEQDLENKLTLLPLRNTMSVEELLTPVEVDENASWISTIKRFGTQCSRWRNRRKSCSRGLNEFLINTRLLKYITPSV